MSDSDVRIAYDPSRTVRLKNPPECLENIRHKEPQATIDYLHARKEAYKQDGQKHAQRAYEAEKKLNEALGSIKDLESRIKRLKVKYKEVKSMKDWYKYVSITTGAAALILVALLLTSNHGGGFRSDIPKVPTSGSVQKTHNNVLSSVNIFNGDVQGSGVVISKGEKSSALLSAGHNFKGVLGGQFWVYFPNGTYTKGTLLAVDRERDLALAKVDSEAIISHSHLPKQINAGEISGVGYTGGEGPNYRKLNYHRPYFNSAKRYMWEFGVRSGPFWDGDSGSGVFIDDALIGITSQRDALVHKGGNCYERRLYACSYEEILEFLQANKDKIADCGDYFEPAPIQVVNADEPPPWTPKPNVPVITENRSDKLIAELRAEVYEIKKQLETKVPVVEPKKDDGLKRPSEIK